MMDASLSWLQAFASSHESTTMPSADFCPITSCIAAWGAPTNGGRKAGQISPGKNMIFPYTTAAFTSPHVLRTDFGMLCSLAQGFGLICDFCPSARRFALRLLSDLGSPLSPCLRLVLFEGVKMTTSRKMYKGLAPHKIMPMPGTHNHIHSDSKKRRGFRYATATPLSAIGSEEAKRPPSAHRTVRTGPYTAPHVRLIH